MNDTDLTPAAEDATSDAQTVIREAKEDWLRRYDGAMLNINQQFNHRVVAQMAHRSFDIIGRHSHFVSVIGRILLSQKGAAIPKKQHDVRAAFYGRVDDDIEALLGQINGNIANAAKEIDRHIAQYRAIMDDAQIATNATFSHIKTLDLRVINPIQTHFLNLCRKADEELTLLYTLWLMGEIKDRDKNKRESEIKSQLRAVSSASRNMFIGMRKRLNSEHGDRRPAAAIAAEAEADVSAGGDSVESPDTPDTSVTMAEVVSIDTPASPSKPAKAAKSKPAPALEVAADVQLAAAAGA